MHDQKDVLFYILFVSGELPRKFIVNMEVYI